MKYSCIRCRLLGDIERMKIERENLIFENKADILATEVAKLTRRISSFEKECANCQTRIDSLENADRDSVFGCHISFYYYGLQHLIMNMYRYVAQGFKSNELALLSMEQEIFDEIVQLLKHIGIPDEYVRFHSVEEIISSNKEFGIHGLKQTVDKMIESAKKEGFSGIRWIGQPSYAVRKTSKEDFIALELALTEAISKKDMSVLCIYDSYEWIARKKYDEADVMSKLMQTHTHIMGNIESE